MLATKKMQDLGISPVGRSGPCMISFALIYADNAQCRRCSAFGRYAYADLLQDLVIR